ncbi:MAG: hypothetical protein KAS86_03595 [Candidatus Omnitrophica bacterium]|nr:hypothetical protein [Candidatus Omnitrophota bacterium]
MIAYMLIILGFAMRLLPHVPNTAPVAAIAIFAGMYLDRRIVPWVPLGIMMLSDIVMGLHDVVLYTWGAFLLIGFIGTWLKRHRSPANILLTCGGSSLLFFAISNFGVWRAWYPRTPEGFITCYISALPFLRNTLISNLVSVFALVGAYELARKLAEGTRFRRVLLVNSEQ